MARARFRRRAAARGGPCFAEILTRRLRNGKRAARLPGGGAETLAKCGVRRVCSRTKTYSPIKAHFSAAADEPMEIKYGI